MRVMWFAGAVIALAGSAVAVPPVPSAWFSGTGSLEGFNGSRIEGLSGDGSVAVGQVSSGAASLPVMWTLGGGLHPLGQLPGAAFGDARAASFDGKVIVGQSGQRAFRWTQVDGIQDLGTLADDNQGFSSAWGVSEDGHTILGTAASNTGFDVFRWRDGSGMQNEGFFDGSGLSAAGSAFVATDARAGGGFAGVRVVDGQGATDLGMLAGVFDATLPHAITRDASKVVGECAIAAEPFTQGLAFLWEQGSGIRSLSDFAGGQTLSRASDISDDGTLIGGWGSEVTGRRAAVWLNGGPILSAQNYLLGLGITGLQGWRLTEVSAISPDGLTLAGVGINPAGLNEGWVAHIPSPGAGVLGGLSVVMLSRRRRRR